jgi:hypothetical protein
MSLAIARKQSPDNTHKPKCGSVHDTLKSPHTANPSLSVVVIQRLSNCPCGGGCPRCSGSTQPEVKIAQPSKQYEKEADRVAEQVMRMHGPGWSPEVKPVLGSRIQALRGSGQPLPKSVRAFFEPRFGHDFSNVSIHTDTKAVEAAQAADARAFTTGHDIVFGAGQFSPETLTGKRLLKIFSD